jgi:nitrogen-specific signal transduction histidine kinase
MSAVIDDAITVHRDYETGLPALTCYASELNQAWTNIVTNAVDAIRATDSGCGDITVRTNLADTAVIRVEICDTGVGIPADIRDRVFLPFFTTKPVGMGVGMGLDLAWRTIVGRHHGSLGVASVPRDTRRRVPAGARRRATPVATIRGPLSGIAAELRRRRCPHTCQSGHVE